MHICRRTCIHIYIYMYTLYSIVIFDASRYTLMWIWHKHNYFCILNLILNFYFTYLYSSTYSTWSCTTYNSIFMISSRFSIIRILFFSVFLRFRTLFFLFFFNSTVCFFLFLGKLALDSLNYVITFKMYKILFFYQMLNLNCVYFLFQLQCRIAIRRWHGLK